MKDFRDFRLVLAPAKGALIRCGMSMALALTVAVSLGHYQGSKGLALAQSEAQLQNTRVEVQTLTQDLAVLEEQLPNFRHLVSIGLIGDPPREIWVQRLEATYNSLDLPQTLRYTLSPPQPLADDRNAVAAVAAEASATKAMRHDLEIELSGIHEGEFLAFIDKLRTDWQAPFRLETCQMERDTTGVKIMCTLRLFSLSTAQEGQPAGG